ncbi:MAG TPA: ABC transporter permease [Candidatus Wallbacteria bacterium]|nr:ABC transporter permease [Candidatus Wallbacteria bacterium]
MRDRIFKIWENISPFFRYEFVYRHNYMKYLSYPIGLLVITACFLFGQWPTKYELTVDTIGDKFYIYIMVIIIIVSAVIGSLHAAISISSEKERKTLTLLRMSGLSPVEIISGKALNSVMFILLLVLPQLPLLIWCPFLGGISFAKTFMGIAVFLIMTFFYAVVGTSISILFKKNFMATSFTIFIMLFLHFGMYVIDDIFGRGSYYYSNRSAFFSTLSPMEVWNSFFYELYYSGTSYAEPGHFKTTVLEGVPAFYLTVPLYLLVSIFICFFVARNFESYLKWRED